MVATVSSSGKPQCIFHHSNPRGPFYQHGLVVAPNMKCVMKLLLHSQTSTVQPLKFGNGEVVPSHTLLDMWLLTHAGIKVNIC